MKKYILTHILEQELEILKTKNTKVAQTKRMKIEAELEARKQEVSEFFADL